MTPRIKAMLSHLARSNSAEWHYTRAEQMGQPRDEWTDDRGRLVGYIAPAATRSLWERGWRSLKTAADRMDWMEATR